MLVTRHRVGECMPVVVHAGPDPAALAVCRELVSETSVDCVVLHGSRAWGNWDEQSDLDLIMVRAETDETDRRGLFEALRLAKNRRYPGQEDDIGLKYLLKEGQEAISLEDYASRRRTLNDYIARAARNGLIFTKEPGAEHLYRHDGDISNEWEVVTLERLESAAEWALAVRDVLRPETLLLKSRSRTSPLDVNTMEGRSAHRMFWSSAAALLSILGVLYPRESVEEMARLITEHDNGWDHQFQTDLGKLDQYAYCGCELVVTDPFRDLPELRECLEADRSALWQRILELSGYDLNGEPSPARGGA